MDTGIDALKTACKKVVHKAAEATGQFRGNKVSEIIVKPKHVNDDNPKNVEEIFVLSKKKGRKIKRIKTAFIRIKISKLLNESTASKIASKKWIDVNDLLSG